MRGTPNRFLGTLLTGVAVAAVTACGSGGEDKEACRKIISTMDAVQVRHSTARGDIRSVIQAYEKASLEIVAEGQKARGDIEAAADEVAAAYGDVAAGLRRMNTGDLDGAPDLTAITRARTKLRTACPA
ncbi:hypothetical protein [Actinomadura sp. HBU206391]|uniref:hypothetical protein n=1 Tax=Actinomadura sp. HBU206391 TaxID=2731692 RepID=UPI0016508FAB|nr:hypothetical protein [Actinomadura sp. HBU206391]MBC6461903.1 hypothetical protein [Actinomadura sp. HBU206391]